MNKPLLFGLIGIGVIWGVVSWIKVNGFLDFLSFAFIGLSLLVISIFSFKLLRGETHS